MELKIVLGTFGFFFLFISAPLLKHVKRSVTRSLVFLRCFQVLPSLTNTAHHRATLFTLPGESQHPPEVSS